MRHIFLIGLSGSGKSTVGRLLAQCLDKPFLDVDALIEDECEERIPAIFARHGEAYFRNCESRVLARIVHSVSPSVVATGGGIVVRAENRALMAVCGLRVFLHVEPQTALARLQAQHRLAIASGMVPAICPLLAGPDPLVGLQCLATTRALWYADTDLICSTSERNATQVVQEIVAMLIGSGELMRHDVAPVIQHAQVGAGYDAVVDGGGVGRLGQYLTQLSLPARIFLFTYSNLERLYAASLLQQLKVPTSLLAQVDASIGTYSRRYC